MANLISHSVKRTCRRDLLSSLFHSSSVLTKAKSSGKRQPKQTQPSRKRLVPDLAPKSRLGTLKVATRDKFKREGAPHAGLSPTWDPSVKESHPVRRSYQRRPPGDKSRSRESWDARLERMDTKSEDDASHLLDSETRRRLGQGFTRASDLSNERTTYRQRKLSGRRAPPASNHNPEFFYPSSTATSSDNAPLKVELQKLDQIEPKHNSHEELPTRFSSPPLLPGFARSIHDLLGRNAKPTPIQALSIKWLLQDTDQTRSTADDQRRDEKDVKWKECLLASETGSGKSIAYLLPVLQSLKLSESSAVQGTSASELTSLKHSPRALILAPTHELSRQLSGFAKDLLHEVKLRVLCASRANTRSSSRYMASQIDMTTDFDEVHKSSDRGNGRTPIMTHKEHPVDIVVGTPSKILEMVHGRGWDHVEDSVEEQREVWERQEERQTRVRGKPRQGPPEMTLQNIEWVVVDEADVLFDPDFKDSTLKLLSDISAARGVSISVPAHLPSTSTQHHNSSPPAEPVHYPFNLLLTTATIPASLEAYLSAAHPALVRLASPQLHHLPKTLKIEHVTWSGGNKFADIERRARFVWKEDSLASDDPGRTVLSKILIFCNKSTKVTELGQYLEEKGIKNIALTSTSETRRRGSNHHLDGFLRSSSLPSSDTTTKNSAGTMDPSKTPFVMLTTSLLSRGLDFSPDIGHVFIVDEPRNMIDFLHRAGRTGRAGRHGKVVVFSKGKFAGKGVVKKISEVI